MQDSDLVELRSELEKAKETAESADFRVRMANEAAQKEILAHKVLRFLPTLSLTIHSNQWNVLPLMYIDRCHFPRDSGVKSAASKGD